MSTHIVSRMDKLLKHAITSYLLANACILLAVSCGKPEDELQTMYRSQPNRIINVNGMLISQSAITMKQLKVSAQYPSTDAQDTTSKLLLLRYHNVSLEPLLIIVDPVFTQYTKGTFESFVPPHMYLGITVQSFTQRDQLRNFTDSYVPSHWFSVTLIAIPPGDSEDVYIPLDHFYEPEFRTLQPINFNILVQYLRMSTIDTLLLSKEEYENPSTCVDTSVYLKEISATGFYSVGVNQWVRSHRSVLKRNWCVPHEWLWRKFKKEGGACYTNIELVLND